MIDVKICHVKLINKSNKHHNRDTEMVACILLLRLPIFGGAAWTWRVPVTIAAERADGRTALPAGERPFQRAGELVVRWRTAEAGDGGRRRAEGEASPRRAGLEPSGAMLRPFGRWRTAAPGVAGFYNRLSCAAFSRNTPCPPRSNSNQVNGASGNASHSGYWALPTSTISTPSRFR